MKVEHIYTGCLRKGAYYIQSAGEAAVIDPLNEVSDYLDKARQENSRIKYVFATHLDENTESAYLELNNKAGACLVFGPAATPKFKAYVAKDGEEFHIGNITIQLIHTPGHTYDSSCYLLKDQNNKALKLFTGETVLIGDIGQPQIKEETSAESHEELAGMLYDSIQNKILKLPGSIVLHTARSAGSVCSKTTETKLCDTLYSQLQLNYALKSELTREEFIREVMLGLLPPPHYFQEQTFFSKKNSNRPEASETINLLAADEFESLANSSSATIIDTRNAQKFSQGHIPNSINIGLDGTFAPWVGLLIPYLSHPILIVAETGKEQDAFNRLTHIGYKNISGFLKGGFEGWESPGRQIEKTESITANALYNRIKNNQLTIFDLRKRSEFEMGHVFGSTNIPLEELNEHLQEIPKTKTTYLYCGSGYRSIIAASILASRGWENVIHITGGYKAITGTDIPRNDSYHTLKTGGFY